MGTRVVAGDSRGSAATAARRRRQSVGQGRFPSQGVTNGQQWSEGMSGSASALADFRIEDQGIPSGYKDNDFSTSY